MDENTTSSPQSALWTGEMLYLQLTQIMQVMYFMANTLTFMSMNIEFDVFWYLFSTIFGFIIIGYISFLLRKRRQNKIWQPLEGKQILFAHLQTLDPSKIEEIFYAILSVKPYIIPEEINLPYELSDLQPLIINYIAIDDEKIQKAMIVFVKPTKEPNCFSASLIETIEPLSIYGFSFIEKTVWNGNLKEFAFDDGGLIKMPAFKLIPWFE